MKFTPVNIAGKKFSRLTAVRPTGERASNGGIMWHCICECGKAHVAQAGELRRGTVQSCGCLQKTQLLKHGHSANHSVSSEYTAYRSAKQRCVNPKATSYKYYGARGVEFRFQNLEEFLAEVGPKPTPRHSIDRIDPTGHYESGNVRWATAYEQRHNRRVGA
jgi:hypothetical protein